MIGERWVAVPDWEGLYEVSDFGRVRSLDRQVHIAGPKPHVRTQRGRILSAPIDNHGYPHVVLYRGSDRRNYGAHVLVMLAFVGPRPAGCVTRHLSGDSTDCRLSNLTYGTQSENCYDRVAHGHDRNSLKERCPAGHAYSGANVYLMPRGGRDCRACIRDRARRYRAAKRLAQMAAVS